MLPEVGRVLIAERAAVLRVEHESADVQRVTVRTESESECAAICYPDLTGRVAPGDSVIVNTTAVRLGLGSGGAHFVMWMEGRHCIDGRLRGHIMKLRYTPMQLACGAAEEDEANLAAINAFDGLHGMPVVVCELHSMLTPVAAGLAAAACASGRASAPVPLPPPPPRVVYIMTDGGALPVAMSLSVEALRRAGLIAAVITAGHAFGGDYEAVNIHSALVIAAQVARADAAIVCMGPGVVGTGTRFGTTAMEQGPALDAVTRLDGRAILTPRLARGDSRGRHTPVSHHTITLLEQVCCLPCDVVLASDMDAAFLDRARQALAPALDAGRHRLRLAQGTAGVSLARAAGLPLSTMGRGYDDEPDFFLTCAAAGAYAAAAAVSSTVPAAGAAANAHTPWADGGEA
jgi:hypothetical protein